MAGNTFTLIRKTATPRALTVAVSMGHAVPVAPLRLSGPILPFLPIVLCLWRGIEAISPAAPVLLPVAATGQPKRGSKPDMTDIARRR